MSFIAYLDLLGTKNASSDRDLYQSNIDNFTNVIEGYAPYLDNVGEIGMFSDCLYIQCSDLPKILYFLSVLRRALIGNNLFFNAAISKGHLATTPFDFQTPTKNNTLYGISFKSGDIADIYYKQMKFRGTGIWVDNCIVDEYKDDGFYQFVESFYFAKSEKDNEDKYTAVKYYDIPLFMKDDNDLETQRKWLYAIFKAIYVSHRKSIRYSSYYIPLLVNILRTCDLSNLKWNNSKATFENAPINFSLMYNFLVQCNKYMDDLVGLADLCFSLIDVLYNTSNVQNNIEAITHKIMSDFTCINEKNIRNLNSIPKHPFTNLNHQKFINYCTKEMASDFIKNITSDMK